MPTNIETYSTCAGPGTARPHTRIGFPVGTILAIWEGSTIGKILLSLAAGGMIALIFAGPGICVMAGIIIIAAAQFRHWYYNERLLCIRSRDCAIGEVIAEPDVATDGDRKLNLLLAPFTRTDLQQLLASHLERNRILLSDPANFPADFFPGGMPILPSAAQLADGDPTNLKSYMSALRGEKEGDEDADSDIYSQVLTGFVDILMQLPPNRVYERFLRKLAFEIPDAATRDYIPVDFAPPSNTIGWDQPNAINTQTFFNRVMGKTFGLNPMFRYDNRQLSPYLHCEIEGHNIAVWMDDAIFTASGVLAGCIIFGPLGGLALGFLSWLLKKLIDWLSGNDGDAADPEVDWDDPEIDQPEVYGE
ncbi:MAG: hypothetical protein MUF15_01865, partial [Acidobacteria bacterium]|nr:hypothetical protein [Acidobacteriota bacterium]